MKRPDRVRRLSHQLSARERAVLCIRAVLERSPEDPLVRETMPFTQVEEFNRLIALENGVLHVLPYAFCLAKDAERARWHFDFLLAVNTKEADALMATAVPPELRALWSALLAYEQLTDEIADEFESPLVLPAPWTQAIQHTRDWLLELHDSAQQFLGVIALDPVDVGVMQSLRDGVCRDARLYLDHGGVRWPTTGLARVGR